MAKASISTAERQRKHLHFPAEANEKHAQITMRNLQHTENVPHKDPVEHLWHGMWECCVVGG